MTVTCIQGNRVMGELGFIQSLSCTMAWSSPSFHSGSLWKRDDCKGILQVWQILSSWALRSVLKTSFWNCTFELIKCSLRTHLLTLDRQVLTYWRTLRINKVTLTDIDMTDILKIHEQAYLDWQIHCHMDRHNSNIIIIVIALIGAIQDFLQSSHCAMNYIQHVCWSGQGANHVQHIKGLLCATCHVPRGTKGQLSCLSRQSLNRIYFSFFLLVETINRWRRAG